MARHRLEGARRRRGTAKQQIVSSVSSLHPRDRTEELLFSVGINRAVSLLAEKKAGGSRPGRATPAALKSLGEHPTEGGAMTVRDGRYGPYVNHGKVNATLPKGMDPASITLDQAVELIAARVEKGPGRAKRRAPAKAPRAKRAKVAAEADQD